MCMTRRVMMTRFIWGNNIINRKWQSHYETTQSPCVGIDNHYEGIEVTEGTWCHCKTHKVSLWVAHTVILKSIQVIWRLHNVTITESHCEAHTESLWWHTKSLWRSQWGSVKAQSLGGHINYSKDTLIVKLTQTPSEGTMSHCEDIQSYCEGT